MHKSNVKHKIGCNNPTFAQNWIDSAPNGKIHRQKFVILKGGNPEFKGMISWFLSFLGFVGHITYWENQWFKSLKNDIGVEIFILNGNKVQIDFDNENDYFL